LLVIKAEVFGPIGEGGMRLKHWLVFFLLGAIWSSSFMWIKIALLEVSPVTLVGIRVLFGLAFGIGVAGLTRSRFPTTLKEWAPLLVVGVTNLAMPFFLISWGERSIDSALAAILDATVPLFTIVFAHYLLEDDRMTPAKVLGLGVGFLGVMVLLGRALDGSTGSLLGQGAVVLASMLYAGSSIYVRKTMADTPGIVRSAGPMVSATAVMWMAASLSETPIELPRLGMTWLALAFLGVFGSGLALSLAFYLIHEIGPTRTTMVTYLFPLGGVILGVIVLKERLTWELIAGAALILTGLVVANREPEERSTAIDPEPASPDLQGGIDLALDRRS
jgi:drug/metabolite transporter (DMT)-like permease